MDIPARLPALHGGICFAMRLIALAAFPAFANEPPEADRKAIMAMQGEYSVNFSFEETATLAHGYERAEPYRTGGHETVVLVENSPNRIVLQHLLLHVPSGHVTKHWRQDWTYEAPRRWEFTSDQTWRWRDIPAGQVQGSWTQCVYEVSDAPRYCGTGRWVHANGIATWTSDTTWRPLPRRDYTKRSDYNALGAINRHTITPAGWTHEQDNIKAIRDEHGDVQGVVVREFGFNDYQHTNAIDFTPVYGYWKATADYWSKVRAHWHQRLHDTSGIRLLTKLDGMELIEPLFQQAQRIQEGGPVDDAELDTLFTQWVLVVEENGGEITAP